MRRVPRWRWMIIVGGLLATASGRPSLAMAQTARGAAPTSAPAPPVVENLTPQQWSDTQRCVDLALAWMASEQQPDGSFPTMETGQPGVTALCVLAFLATGHVPGEGRYGQVIDRGVEYILSCQKSNGLIALHAPIMEMDRNNPTHTAVYNHAIAALCLSEAYGMTADRRNPRLREAVGLALRYTSWRMPQPKLRAGDEGGWRYAQRKEYPCSDSDLSVTSWQLMFLRSARNAGFEVSVRFIDEALAYVERCYDPETGAFFYALYAQERNTTRAMTAAGILSLSLGGKHGTPVARRAGDWLLRHPFDRYNVGITFRDRFFYGAFYCSQAMFQLGGRHWREFFPVLLRTLRSHQRPDGAWDSERGWDAPFGETCSTALATLALSPPYQLLPVLQR